MTTKATEAQADWSRLAQWFDEAVEAATPADAAAVLERARAEDPELGHELAALLLEDQAATSAERSSGDTTDPLAEIVGRASRWLDGPAERTNEHLGPYRLIREVGRGGLGTVYLAERADEDFPLQVALKIVDRRFGSPRDRERLIEERRILATLDHPNIARVFDAGAADDGTPYFALEFLEGEPIDQHADRLRLSIDQRLRLFLGVAEAVAYAHRRLVIHRDIKPSNVLVSAQGTPKLLDFGIAKMLEGERTDLTRPEERMLTPDYASPEQIRGEPLTTATDIYSLGALLYALLTGRPPLRFRGQTAAQIERRLNTEEPLATSAAVLASDDTAQEGDPDSAELAALRSTTVGRLPRLLRGDLDTIVARALHKEAGRRYPSVEQFAEDVQRHLTNRPISARSDSLAYRARRFVRRHRVGVTAAGLVALAVAGGWMSTAREMRHARLEQARTEQVAGFLVGLFESVDPAIARGSEPTAREILDRGARQLLSRSAAASNTPEHAVSQAPEVQATLLSTVGRVYRQLGHYEEAETLLLRALEIRRGEGAVETARTLVDLAEVDDDRHQAESALARLKEALALQTQALPAEHPDRATTLYRLASVELSRGEIEPAKRALEQSLAIRRRAFGDRSLPVTEARHLGAQIAYRSGQLDQAEAAFTQVLELRRSLLGEDHPLTLTALNDLASVRHDRGDLAGAAELLEKTVALRRSVLGADHPYVATALLNLATVARKSGRLDRAREALIQALSIYRGAFGEEHERTADALSLLAKVEHARGDLPAAEALARRALGVQRRLRGETHVEVARIRLELGLIASDQRRFPEAERQIRECLRVQELTLGRENPALAFALAPLGELLVKLGRAEEAVPILRRALKLRESTTPTDPKRIADAKDALDRALRIAGKARLPLSPSSPPSPE